MTRLWRRHPWLVSAFVLACVAALAFGGAALRRASAWHDADPGPVQAWMTPRYLVHAYRIPPEALERLLGRKPDEGPRDTLAELAAARGVPVADLIAALEAERAGQRTSDDRQGGSRDAGGP